ncbi:hypothetical protein [Bradyrhizobium sp. B120]|uniref:hypothetical protein n=1 Tax=Bradyrhizobium sp. B120 TaxID=3410088 RepID=UPI003B980DD0
MIRMMLAEMLEVLGHTVAAEAGYLEQAIELANRTEFDFAVLDINLDGRLSAPVAEILRSRKLPFIGSTCGSSLSDWTWCCLTPDSGRIDRSF